MTLADLLGDPYAEPIRFFFSVMVLFGAAAMVLTLAGYLLDWWSPARPRRRNKLEED